MTTAKATSVKGVSALLKAGKAGQHAAGGNLYLKVNGENKGSWFFRYKVEGKTSRMGLGSTDAATLAQARQMAAEQRALLAQGIDPLEHRNAQDEAIKAETITFDQVAADYIEAQSSSWTNAKHAQQWANTLATYASPVIGHLAPADVTTEHILKSRAATQGGLSMAIAKEVPAFIALMYGLELERFDTWMKSLPDGEPKRKLERCRARLIDAITTNPQPLQRGQDVADDIAAIEAWLNGEVA